MVNQFVTRIQEMVPRADAGALQQQKEQAQVHCNEMMQLMMMQLLEIISEMMQLLEISETRHLSESQLREQV